MPPHKKQKKRAAPAPAPSNDQPAKKGAAMNSAQLCYSEPRCASCSRRYDLAQYMPRQLPCGDVVCSACVLKNRDEDDMFRCPYCSHEEGYQAVQAPLASSFPPQPDLLTLLSGKQPAPLCDNCPPENASTTAAVHCTQCSVGLCSGCDSTVHARALKSHVRVPVDEAVRPTMCPLHDQPISGLCDQDGALLCPSCQTSATHRGHQFTAIDQSLQVLQGLASTLLEELLADCRKMSLASVDCKAQLSVAEFISETQCAFASATAEKAKALVDCATSIVCTTMRGQVKSIRAQQGTALGSLSRSSARAAVSAHRGTARMDMASAPKGAVLVGLVAELRATREAILPGTSPVLAKLMMMDGIECCPLLHPPVVLNLKPSRAWWTGLQNPRRVVACGTWHTTIVTKDSSLVTWGGVAADAPAGMNFVSVAAGDAFSVALTSEGRLVSWVFADNDDDDDDDVVESDKLITDTPTGTDFVSVAAGPHHSVAVTAEGRLVSWGYEGAGEVTDTPAGTGFVSVAAGAAHCVALTEEGRLVSWGADNANQVADTPTDTGFVSVAAGGDHSVALTAEGHL
eukprot:gene12018-biopygen1970